MELAGAHGDIISPAEVGLLIRDLKLGRSAGPDGILSEHLLYSSSYFLHVLISDLFSICVSFHVVQAAFATGLLIPVLKKPHLDTAKPKNYRPITISSTIAKLSEKFILGQCDGHEFNELQFGFREGLGTDIAATLASDVISHCNFAGSTVYLCSLDAEGAFDCIPHSVLFQHCYGVLPDHLWMTMYHWYTNLSVQIRWSGHLSEPLKVLQGTRQGGLSSPFLFNTFYQEMVDTLSEMEGGIMIGENKYNVFCYADDILLASLTMSGLQKMIDTAYRIISSKGLRFNPAKSVCATFGKCPFDEATWVMNHSVLNVEESISASPTLASSCLLMDAVTPTPG